MAFSMEYATTLLVTILSLGFTWKLNSFVTRFSIVLVSTYAGAYLSYWVPFWFSPSDQAQSWQWLAINLYFIVASVFGLVGSLIIMLIKKSNAKSHAI
jgi:hypothetical protein